MSTTTPTAEDFFGNTMVYNQTMRLVGRLVNLQGRPITFAVLELAIQRAGGLDAFVEQVPNLGEKLEPVLQAALRNLALQGLIDLELAERVSVVKVENEGDVTLISVEVRQITSVRLWNPDGQELWLVVTADGKQETMVGKRIAVRVIRDADL